MAAMSLSATYTGNDVYLEYENPATHAQTKVAFGQTLTVTKSAGQTPIYDFGSNIPQDIAATRASVTVTVTDMVVKPSAVQAVASSLGQAGVNPTSSLMDVLQMAPFTISMYGKGGIVLVQATGCAFDSGTLTASNTAPITFNATFQATDLTDNLG